MRAILALSLVCLSHLGAARRVHSKSEHDTADSDGFKPNDAILKCKPIEDGKERAHCVCSHAEDADEVTNEINRRCKQMKMPMLRVNMGRRPFAPYTCAYSPLVDGCKAWHPKHGLYIPAAPENPDGPKVNDDNVEEELEEKDGDSEETKKDKEDLKSDIKEGRTFICTKNCKVEEGADACTSQDADDADLNDFCKDKCVKLQEADTNGDWCHSKSDPDKPFTPVVEKKHDDDTAKKNDDMDDLDDLEEDLQDDLTDEDDPEEDEEDLGESDEVKEEKEKEPEKVMTCASLTKSATPGNMATMAQLKKWCGTSCGNKLKMRTWAICGLADGRVHGPGYNGAINNHGSGPYDCYINCKGQAEAIGGVVEDCISEWGSWGPCSANCEGGWQRRQLNIKKYPSGGGIKCPAPPSRRCHTHKCPKCFPADATVDTPSGSKMMSDLRVGDLVRTVDGAGKPVYDEVYFFGHAENSESNEYVNLKLSDASLQLSHNHFVPMCPQHGESCIWADHIHAYAQDVRPGDYIWTADNEVSKLHKVLQTSVVTKNGLYNPYTLSGKIVVNGVVASAHSDWVLDDFTPSWMTRYLPAVYQVLFLPGRVLYQLAGASAADFLDMNNPQLTAQGHGPEFVAVCLVGGLTALVMALSSKHLR